MLSLIKHLDGVYEEHSVLWNQGFTYKGSEWIDGSDGSHSVISYLRHSTDDEDVAVVVHSFTGIPHGNYRVGLPSGGVWEEILNADGLEYDGSGIGNFEEVKAEEVSWDGCDHSVLLEFPLFGVIYLIPKAGQKPAKKIAAKVSKTVKSSKASKETKVPDEKPTAKEDEPKKSTKT